MLQSGKSVPTHRASVFGFLNELANFFLTIFWHKVCLIVSMEGKMETVNEEQISHLLSDCSKKIDICYGCEQSVKPNVATGRWFITMGHPGFNSTTNNGFGYADQKTALRAVRYYAIRKPTKL